MTPLSTLRLLQRAGAGARAAGLGWLPKIGRLALARVPVRLSVECEGLRVSGFVEHWSYLNGLQNGLSEDYRASLFADAVRPGSVVLDLGAYIGRFSLVAASRTGPSGKIYAFEPDPRNHRALLGNVKENGFERVIFANREAVSDRDEHRRLQIADWPLCGSSLFEARGSRAIITECVSIDSFLPPDVRVHVVKMDIEGAEVHALRGMRRALGRSLPDVVMLVECNPPKLRAANESPVALIRSLVDLGFRISVVDEGERALKPLRSLRDLSDFKGYLYCVGAGGPGRWGT